MADREQRNNNLYLTIHANGVEGGFNMSGDTHKEAIEQTINALDAMKNMLLTHIADDDDSED